MKKEQEELVEQRFTLKQRQGVIFYNPDGKKYPFTVFIDHLVGGSAVIRLEVDQLTIGCLLGPAWRVAERGKRRATGARLNFTFSINRGMAELVGRGDMNSRVAWNPETMDTLGLSNFQGVIRLNTAKKGSKQRQLILQLPPMVTALSSGMKFVPKRDAEVVDPVKPTVTKTPVVAEPTVVEPTAVLPFVPISRPVENVPEKDVPEFESPQDEVDFLLGVNPKKKKVADQKPKKHRKAA